MPERKLERRSILDPAVADLLSNMEKKQAVSQLPQKIREKKAREREKIRKRREQRVTYDLPPDLRQQIKNLAAEHRVPASQLVTLALVRFIEAYQAGQVDLGIYKQISNSPRYEWNLVLPDHLLKKTYRKRSVTR